MASSEQIRMIQGVLRDCGIEVEGGLTTVIPTPEGAEPKPRMFETFCYNDPGMREKLREVSAFMGRHFRRFMLDDFFFTDCTCADCIRERDAYNKAHGITDGSWKAYRLDLMRRVSEEDIIAPAATPGDPGLPGGDQVSQLGRELSGNRLQSQRPARDH